LRLGVVYIDLLDGPVHGSLTKVGRIRLAT
jgi:hypothetical protein